jgi:hypothetical protein
MALVGRKIVEIDWNKDNEGFTVQGRLVKIESVRYNHGFGLVYTVRSSKPGEVIRFKGSSRLNVLLSSADVGKEISVRYDGEDTSKKLVAGMNFPKVFTVLVDDSAPGDVNRHGVAVSERDVPF